MASLTMKSRGTRVTKMPYWCPTDSDGKGGWRFVPVGDTHRQQAEHRDPETDQRIGSQGVYEAKGWTPVYSMPANDPRRKSLPTNWQEFCRGDAKRPVFGNPDAAA